MSRYPSPQVIHLEVIRLRNGRQAGDYFASLVVDGVAWNAPGGTPGQAALSAWTSWTHFRADVCWVLGLAR